MSTQNQQTDASQSLTSRSRIGTLLKTKTWLLPTLILGIAVLVCAALLSSKPSIKQVAIEPPVTTIRVIEAKTADITLSVESRGKVQPATISEVAAAVSGPVAWISPSLVAGGYFKQGEVLLRIDTRDLQTALEKSQAAKMQAEAEATHAAKEYSRIADLAAKKLASDSQLQDAKRTAEVNAGRLLNAQADLSQAQLNLSRAELKAPFDAIVEQRNIELGQNVSPGQSVATLFGANVVEVRLPLANRQMGFLTVSPSYRGTLSADEAPNVKLTGVYGGQDHVWYGKLVRTEAGLDASNNTVQAIVQVTQPDAAELNDDESGNAIPLPIGLLVEAEITGRTVSDVIPLPRHVIRKNTQVLVADNEGRLRIREVSILRLESDRVLIQGGLNAGEKVCVSPIQAVIDGMRVKALDESET